MGYTSFHLIYSVEWPIDRCCLFNSFHLYYFIQHRINSAKQKGAGLRHVMNNPKPFVEKAVGIETFCGSQAPYSLLTGNNYLLGF